MKLIGLIVTAAPLLAVLMHQIGLTWWRTRLMWREYEHRHHLDNGDDRGE